MDCAYDRKTGQLLCQGVPVAALSLTLPPIAAASKQQMPHPCEKHRPRTRVLPPASARVQDYCEYVLY